MGKKIRWSKGLASEYEKLREVCKKLRLTEEQGVEHMGVKILSVPQNSYDIVLETNRIMLLSYDVARQTLHLYFMEKRLRDFLCSTELMDYDDLKKYIIGSGNFYPVSDWDTRKPVQVFDFPFCIHIPYEKHGYSFNCQIINGAFNLVAIKEGGVMLTEQQYKALIKIPEEDLSDKRKGFIKLYRLAFNTIAYINCFKDYVKDGVPDLEKEFVSFSNRKIVEISQELHEEIEECLKNPSIRAPHIKSGHFMYLKDERYTNKRWELVWRKPCMVKGRAKTVYTNEELLDSRDKK